MPNGFRFPSLRQIRQTPLTIRNIQAAPAGAAGQPLTPRTAFTTTTPASPLFRAMTGTGQAPLTGRTVLGAGFGGPGVAGAPATARNILGSALLPGIGGALAGRRQRQQQREAAAANVQQVAANRQQNFMTAGMELGRRAIGGDVAAAQQLAQFVGPQQAQAFQNMARQEAAQAAAAQRVAQPELERQTPEQRAALFEEARGLLSPQRAAVEQRLREMAGQAFEGTAEQLNVRGLSPQSGIFAQELTRQILPQVTQAQLGLEQQAAGLGERFAGAGRGEAGTAFQGLLQERGQNIELLRLQQAQAMHAQGLISDQQLAEEEARARKRAGVFQGIGGLLGLAVGSRFGAGGIGAGIGQSLGGAIEAGTR